MAGGARGAADGDASRAGLRSARGLGDGLAATSSRRIERARRRARGFVGSPTIRIDGAGHRSAGGRAGRTYMPHLPPAGRPRVPDCPTPPTCARRSRRQGRMSHEAPTTLRVRRTRAGLRHCPTLDGEPQLRPASPASCSPATTARTRWPGTTGSPPPRATMRTARPRSSRSTRTTASGTPPTHTRRCRRASATTADGRCRTCATRPRRSRAPTARARRPTYSWSTPTAAALPRRARRRLPRRVAERRLAARGARRAAGRPRPRPGGDGTGRLQHQVEIAVGQPVSCGGGGTDRSASRTMRSCSMWCADG